MERTRSGVSDCGSRRRNGSGYGVDPVKYRFIAADPPWQHNSRHHDPQGQPRPENPPGHGRSRPLPDHADLGDLRLGAPTCRPWLRVIPGSMWVLERTCRRPFSRSWTPGAFEQVGTLFAWIKTNKHDGKPKFGVGKYSAGNLERRSWPAETAGKPAAGTPRLRGAGNPHRSSWRPG